MSPAQWRLREISHDQKAVILTGDRIVPLVDGPEILGEMGRAIALAKEYVYITAWMLHLDVRMGGPTLRNLLLEKAKQGVKIKILWCDIDVAMGGPGATPDIESRWAEDFLKQDTSGNIEIAISPMQNISSRGRALQDIGSNLRKKSIVLGSHHQKTVIIDGKVGFCSGCDITVDASNKEKWHDVSAMIRGRGVYGLEDNFVERWNKESKGYAGISIGKSAKKSDVVEIVRTMPAWWTDAAQIRDCYLELIQCAKTEIRQENQYLRSPEIGKALEDAARRGVEVRIIVPARPEEAGTRNIDIQTRLGIYAQYRVLKRLAKYKKQVRILSPAHRLRPYIHAKILVTDRAIALIGSANANGRSLNAQSDSEINVRINDLNFASELLKKLDAREKSWSLVDHDIDADEILSRITATEFRGLKEMIAPNAPSRSESDRGILAWVGDKYDDASRKARENAVSMLARIAGFGGAIDAKTPEELREALVDSLIDFL